MNVDIYIKERNGSREIRIPILPEKIEYESGGVTVASYDIMNKGEVVVPTGSGLAGLSWNSEFPGRNRADTSMLRGKWQDPSVYHNILNDWKVKGTPLNVLVTNYPINMDVYLEDYKGVPTGAFGDMEYNISFIEDRILSVGTPQTTNSGSSAPKKRAAKETTSYTIKKGDTLWAIAQKFLGSGAKWETIYNANKDIIEQTAKKYGKSSSDHGWWIYPGVTLTIPK